MESKDFMGFGNFTGQVSYPHLVPEGETTNCEGILDFV